MHGTLMRSNCSLLGKLTATEAQRREGHSESLSLSVSCSTVFFLFFFLPEKEVAPLVIAEESWERGNVLAEFLFIYIIAVSSGFLSECAK